MLSPTQTKIIQMYSPLTFDEKKHLYFWNGKQVPFSVTGLLKRHYPAFDADKMLPGSAMKASRLEFREVTVHEMRKRWQMINTTALELGTNTHRFMENYTGLENPSTPQEKAGVKYIRSLKDEYRISFRELRVYSKQFNYAGTIDLPLQKIGKEEYVIDDYKTNADLFKAFDYMYPPFEMLESSAYNHIQLQLSYYQIALNEVGLNIVDRRLIHLKADAEYRIFPLIDLTQQLKDYMKHQMRYN